MSNALNWLWPMMETPELLVAAHVVAGWPAGVLERLLALEFLVQAADADRVLCPECHTHIEEVIASVGPGELPRFYIPCPEVQRAPVPPEARRRWLVNLARVADALAATLGLTGACVELLPGRLWRLGRATWQGSPREVKLACGLHWDDAETVRAAIARGRKPVVFVPATRPPDDLWRGRMPPILVLSQVATLARRGIELDPLELAAGMQDADERTTAPPAVSPEQLRLMIRQQVKAEAKTSLTDDILVTAYRQHGSVREAAAFLSQQTGHDVSKDQVHRAVLRTGGAAAVLSAENSESVVRSAPSARGRKVKNTHRSEN